MGSSSSNKVNYLNIQEKIDKILIEFLQKAKNRTCQIILDNNSYCFGCFCKIPYTNNNNNYLNALLTCHDTLNKSIDFSNNKIKIKVNNSYKVLSLKNRKNWYNKELDYYCIEIKDEDKINDFYQIDDIILKNDYKNELYFKKHILIFTIMEDGKIGHSNGLIEKIENYCFFHNCNVDKGYSGGVIINNNNNYIIGIHKGEDRINNNINSSINMGIFIYDIIKDIKDQVSIKNNKIKFGEKFIKEIGFDYNEYLYIEPELFEKSCLKLKYDNFLKEKNIYKEKLEKIIYDIFENKEIKSLEEEDIDKIENNCEKLINIDSPLFKIISETKNFYKIFTIHISQKIIDKYNLKDEYIKFFDNNNNLNINYTSIYFLLDNINKINYLKEMNVDFNKIKRLTLKIEENYNERNENQKNNKVFFESLFSFNNIENNLVYLKINFKYNNKISPLLFDNINNFKKLKYLYIDNLYFEKGFIIRSNALKLISINHCENIIFSENFKDLELLDLSKNYKLDINALEKVNFNQLKIIDLSWNKISDINKLENINLKDVKSFYLNGNKILDINILKKIDFKKLEKLNLSDNEILNIIILEKVNFKELKELNLHHNKISDINILERVNFNELKKLDLSCNNISDIDVLVKVNFKNLKELNLSYNKISDINILEKVNFNYLESFDLSWNKISDINILEKVNFKELRKLYLHSNNISDINVLEKVNFKDLKELYLSWNKISDINILEKVNFNELEILDLSCNNISDINKLEKLNFKKLVYILLNGNNISDTNILKKEIHKTYKN